MSTSNEKVATLELPLLPLRDLIIFPHMMMPLFVGREKSINALEEAMSKQIDIVLAAQQDAKTNNPQPDEIYKRITTLLFKRKKSKRSWPTPLRLAL